MEIKFGTSGWRGIIAEDFTKQGVRIVAQAIADYLKASKVHSREIVVGYDPRFMGEDFAKECSEVLAGNGFLVLYSDKPVPTPVIAYEVIRRKCAGAINITASHNPAQYSGVKFSPAWGGPALPETTKQIEENCKKITDKDIKKLSFEDGIKAKKIKVVSFKKTYLNRVERLIDFRAIQNSGIKIAVDDMYGAGIGYIEELLDKYHIKYTAINTHRDCLFGGHHPEPSGDHLNELADIVTTKKYKIGLALDGDADRFGIIDSDGAYISPNEIIAVLLDHLVKSRGWKGRTARSVMTTSFVDAVAKMHGVEVNETPVGFKYIGDILVKQGLIIGGEESGGLTIKGHVPEKDGIVACLLVAEMVAMSNKSIRTIINELQKKVGTFITDRVNLRLSEEKMTALKEKLKKNPPIIIAGKKVMDINKTDGYKFIFENGEWVGVRLSGTEPIVRYYIEAHSKASAAKLKKAVHEVVK